MTREEENRIIRRILGGDKNAFAELVRENQNNVYGLCLRLMKNEQDALDASQDAFIKAYETLPDFRGQSRFSVWLYRIAYNLCIDRLRSASKRKVSSLTYDDEDSAEAQIPDTRYDPESEYAKKELRASLTEAIASLSEEHRQVLLMREYSGMSYEDIAVSLGISEGTVKSRLSRARRAAAKILTEKGTFPSVFRQKNKEGKEVRRNDRM